MVEVLQHNTFHARVRARTTPGPPARARARAPPHTQTRTNARRAPSNQLLHERGLHGCTIYGVVVTIVHRIRDILVLKPAVGVLLVLCVRGWEAGRGGESGRRTRHEQVGGKLGLTAKTANPLTYITKTRRDVASIVSGSIRVVYWRKLRR